MAWLRRTYPLVVIALWTSVLALFLTAIRHLPLVAIVVVPVLSASLAAHADGPITEIVTRIDSEVRTFAGAQPQADDMTAVIIRRTA